MTEAGPEPSDVDSGSFNPELSILGNLKERRQQVVEKQYLDRAVPRWSDPEIFVRFKPVDHATIRKAMDATDDSGGNRRQRREAGKKARGELQANIDVLIEGCVGVYAVLDGNRERKYSLRKGDPRGEWTKFDPELADNLGIEAGSATEVVRALYLADGDIMTTAGAIAEFSGYREDTADEAIEGE